MINDTMEKIEQKIRKSVHITDENKAEYLSMLETLRSEVDALAKTQKEQAETISNFAGATAHEAMRNETRKDLLDISIDGLKTSVEGFEVSNPGLVSIVNSFCSLLANIGI
jgi:ABC-type Zn uptake system ZnuABC Zn-binding protein ZnuA